MNEFDISIVLTAHCEGVLSGATAMSVSAAKNRFESEHSGLAEIIVVLDNADQTTRETLYTVLGGRATFIETTTGDPGQSRNEGILQARGRFAAFIDGDDLWSENWLSAAWSYAVNDPKSIYHSHCNVVFGKEKNIWWHIDSTSPFFDPLYMQWANYWDAMSLAATSIYRQFPFKKNSLGLGFGHEDWHWNCLTIAASIAHRPVPHTIHFKRRRVTSQMTAVAKADCVVWPL